MKQSFTVSSLDELAEPARVLKDILKPGSVVCFYGEMGAGKTTFIKVLLHEMGVKEEVDSPTFALVNEYRLPNGVPVFHFDFYRIDELEEALDIGLEDYLYGHGICLIEWPQVVESVLPTSRISVDMKETGRRRELSFEV